MKIISGGQTGVDLGALKAAIEQNLPYGGAIPKGRKTEVGPLPLRFDRMTELITRDYETRTVRNVLDSDATLILFREPLTGGTLLTKEIAEQEGKPLLEIDIYKYEERQIIEWIELWRYALGIKTLNVAGPRESNCPGIETKTKDILVKVFQRL